MCAILVGHSTGGDREILCYVARHEKEQVVTAMLIAAHVENSSQP